MNIYQMEYAHYKCNYYYYLLLFIIIIIIIKF